MIKAAHTTFDVLVVGSGMSGICMAAQLKQSGSIDQDNFVILEKAADIGGTWRDNTYPGAACDIPSSLYSYSFHTSDWKEAYTAQEDLLAYARCVADEYKILPHIMYRQEVTSMTWDNTSMCWTVHTAGRREFKARHVVTAVGQLHHPKIPTFPGADTFEGTQVHTATWGNQLKLDDLRGKNVSVVGTGASAVQLIPEVAKVAKHVQVYQRSAPYVAPKPLGGYPKFLRQLVHALPFLNLWYRGLLRLAVHTLLRPAVFGNRFFVWVWEKVTWLNIYVAVRDAKFRSMLWPTYPFGARRSLFSNTYYKALARPNVDVTANDTITALTKTGIKTEKGGTDEIPADIIVYATGFITNPFLYNIHITGREKRRLHEDHWVEKVSHAYLGISTHGFPNFHMLFGPNTNTSYTSVLLFVEEQVACIVRALDFLKEHHTAPTSIEVKRQVEDDFVEEMQRRMESHVYLKATNSWYCANGRVVNNWVSDEVEYAKRVRAVDFEKSYIVR